MTTLVHIYSSHVMDGHRLEIVRRSVMISAGTDTPMETQTIETVLTEDVGFHAIVSHHVWDGCELVIREVKREPKTDRTNDPNLGHDAAQPASVAGA